MIQVVITPELLENSEKREREFFAQFGNYGTHLTDKPEQRKLGYLAEVCVKAIHPWLEWSPTPDVDFVYNGYKFDVKAKGTNKTPKPHYVGSVFEEQANRDADYYIFCSVMNDYSVVYVAGFIPKDEFFAYAKFYRVGDQHNGFKYDHARYNIRYEQLRPMIELARLM